MHVYFIPSIERKHKLNKVCMYKHPSVSSRHQLHPDHLFPFQPLSSCKRRTHELHAQDIILKRVILSSTSTSSSISTASNTILTCGKTILGGTAPAGSAFFPTLGLA